MTQRVEHFPNPYDEQMGGGLTVAGRSRIREFIGDAADNPVFREYVALYEALETVSRARVALASPGVPPTPAWKFVFHAGREIQRLLDKEWERITREDVSAVS